MARAENEPKEVKPMKYKTCPLCGATLDHGERCDCDKPSPEASKGAGEYADNPTTGNRPEPPEPALRAGA